MTTCVAIATPQMLGNIPAGYPFPPHLPFVVADPSCQSGLYLVSQADLTAFANSPFHIPLESAVPMFAACVGLLTAVWLMKIMRRILSR